MMVGPELNRKEPIMNLDKGLLKLKRFDKTTERAWEGENVIDFLITNKGYRLLIQLFKS